MAKFWLFSPRPAALCALVEGANAGLGVKAELATVEPPEAFRESESRGCFPEGGCERQL